MNNPVLNIVLSAVTTTPKTDTQFLNMTLMVDDPTIKDLYLEFSDIDLNLVLNNELLNQAYNSNTLKDYTKIDNTLDNGFNIRMVKDDTVIQVQRIRDYLDELSTKCDKIVFWVSDITLWSQFIEAVYGGSDDHNYEFPHYIDFQPIDITSVIRCASMKNDDYRYVEEITNMDESFTDSSLRIGSFYLSFLKNAEIL